MADKPLTFGSLFAGIGGFDVGFTEARLVPCWAVEIDPDCRRVLAHHWPDVLLLEDVRDCGKHNLPPVDVISFGSPCQDLSVAGKRKGMAGERSGLFYEAVRIVRELQPTLAVWENVPGALSSHAGRDFAQALHSLRECGARDLCWRVLDARYFGVAQRRRRVFLVADFGGERAAQILLESPCGCRHSPTGGEEKSGVANGAGDGPAFSLRGGDGRRAGGARQDGADNLIPDIANSCRTQDRRIGQGWNQTMVVSDKGNSTWIEGRPTRSASDDSGSNHLVAHTLRPEGCDASEDGTGRGTPLVAFGIGSDAVDRSGEGAAGTAAERSGLNIVENLQPSLRARPNNSVAHGMMVRRLTPLECCRLQGFPDDWLDLEPPLSDSAKYRCLGNAVCVAVARWLGKRILASLGKELS